MSIHKALNNVMKEVGYVYKSGKLDIGKGRGYSYAGEVDLIKAIRPHLVKNGVNFYCSNIDVVNSDDFIAEKTWNGSTTRTVNHRFLAVFTFIFTHAESETHIEVKSIGDGIDTGDKSSYKASTGALKYALRQTFVIETGDDPDKIPSHQQETFVNGAYELFFEETKQKLISCASQLDVDSLLNDKTVKHINKLPDNQKIELRNIIAGKKDEFNG